ncbi:MAG: hypothetical protein LLF94_01990 [Chlamydiales bacterium]|nr:hypothetical protein [Chlamydiales bacterium]
MSYFGALPVWAYFILTALVSFLALALGRQIARHIVKQNPLEVQPPLDYMVAAMLGLLAFILAFTFQLAANRFDQRREAVLLEANAIGTTFLRAGYIPEPYQKEVRSLLIEYANLKLQLVGYNPSNEIQQKIQEVQGELWSYAVTIVEKGNQTNPMSLFISSLNDLIDIHARRVLYATSFKVPTILWEVLVIIMILSMVAMGYVAGMKNIQHTGISMMVILAFASVIYLIVDLDKTQEGLLRVTQQPIISVLEMMTSK